MATKRGSKRGKVQRPKMKASEDETYNAVFPKTKGRSQTSPMMLRAIEKDYEMVQLRIEGSTYAAIGQQYGGISANNVAVRIKRALKRTATLYASQADTFREIEGARYDRLLAAAWTKAMDGDLKAIEVCAGIIQRRVALYGLAAQKIEVSGPGGEAIDFTTLVLSATQIARENEAKTIDVSAQPAAESLQLADGVLGEALGEQD